MKLKRVSVKRVPLEVSEQPIRSPRTGSELRILHVPERVNKDRLTVERVLKPGKRWTPEHVHLDFGERFEIVSGIADATQRGSSMRLAAGDVLYVGKGEIHRNVRNCDTVDLVYKQTFEPATDGACGYIRTLAHLLREGRDEDGEVPWSVILAIGDVTREHTYARRLPFVVHRRLLLPLGNYVAGTRGYEVKLARQPRTGGRQKASVQAAGNARQTA